MYGKNNKYEVPIDVNKTRLLFSTNIIIHSVCTQDITFLLYSVIAYLNHHFVHTTTHVFGTYIFYVYLNYKF